MNSGDSISPRSCHGPCFSLFFQLGIRRGDPVETGAQAVNREVGHPPPGAHARARPAARVKRQKKQKKTDLASIESEHDVPQSHLNRGPVDDDQSQLLVNDYAYPDAVAARDAVNLKKKKSVESMHINPSGCP